MLKPRGIADDQVRAGRRRFSDRAGLMRAQAMSDDDEIQRLTEIERITNGKASYLDMDAAFCARMQAAITAGLESAPTGVITTPGTRNPRFVSDATTRYQRQRNEW